jgi:hypothetical protein
LHVILRPARPSGVHDPIDAGHARHAGQFRRIDGRAERMIDLVIEDQRQARDAQHQQEQRGDQARPFVNDEPGPNGGSAQHGCVSQNW